MNIFITSKRGGAGATTINVITSLITAKQFNKSVCIVDLNMKQDYSTLFKLDQRKNIDNLITELGIDGEYIKLEDYIYPYDKIGVVLGTKINNQTYLYKRSSQIKDLLDKLNERYELVFCDISDGLLYSDLISLGVDFYPINIVEQNMLSVSEYRKVMKDGNLKGAIILNKLDNSVYPDQSVFMKAFPGNKLFLLPFAKNIRNFLNITIRNGGVVPLKDVAHEKVFYTEILNICKFIATLSDKDLASVKVDVDDDYSILDNKPKAKPKVTPKKKQKSKFSFLNIFGGGR